MKNFNKLFVWAILTAISLASCSKNDSTKTKKTEGNNTSLNPLIQLANHSNIPALIKLKSGFNAEIFTLVSSSDTLKETPKYVFGGSADGSGMLKTPDGKNFVMVVNNEDNHAVSRITFDETLKPISGEYLLNSDGGQWRLCSGTLATPEEHGFGPYYLSAGESNVEARTHGINPLITKEEAIAKVGVSRELPGLGRWSAENSVPLPKNAYPNKTVILTGEDASGATGGKLAMYVAAQGDLDNGEQYILTRTDKNIIETQMEVGKSYDIEFMKINDHKNLTGRQIQEKTTELNAIRFGRIEDIDYIKTSNKDGKEIYFNATGQATYLIDGKMARTKMGRVYHIVLDPENPLKGKLECILDGDDDNGPAKDFQNPDNICVTQNYVYIQEDSNGYGGEDHDAYIYQYDIKTKQLKVVFELDHRRNDSRFGATSKFGNWEYGSLVDVSDVIGVKDCFTLCIQPHTWKSERFKNPDQGNGRPNEMQGSQILLIKGLPR